VIADKIKLALIPDAILPGTRRRLSWKPAIHLPRLTGRKRDFQETIKRRSRRSRPSRSRRLRQR